MLHFIAVIAIGALIVFSRAGFGAEAPTAGLVSDAAIVVVAQPSCCGE
jgi:hypothetical protein